MAHAATTAGLDVVVDAEDRIVVDGRRLESRLIARAHPHPAELAALAEGTDPPAIVLADRISAAGRDVLRDAGWGWLDRRGHLRIWEPGLRVETATGAPSPRDRAGNAWTTVGLEVALRCLLAPDEPVSARRVATAIGRSVGATHEMISRFTELGLIGPSTHRPLVPDLFWETAAHWPDDGWLAVAAPLEEVATRVGPTSLVRVDDRAASLGGARIPAAGDLPPRAYLTSDAALRKARSLVDRDAETRCRVRLSPVRWLPLHDDHPPDGAHPWRVAHPMVCALRLAADPARGREVVEAWGIVPDGHSP